jgi:hypothetical protein
MTDYRPWTNLDRMYARMGRDPQYADSVWNRMRAAQVDHIVDLVAADESGADE